MWIGMKILPALRQVVYLDLALTEKKIKKRTAKHGNAENVRCFEMTSPNVFKEMFEWVRPHCDNNEEANELVTQLAIDLNNKLNEALRG